MLAAENLIIVDILEIEPTNCRLSSLQGTLIP